MQDATDDNRIRVFVYGTLRAGGRNHHVLAGQDYLGPHTSPPRYTLYDTGPFPAAVAGGETAVIGEVYAVDEPTFAALDRLEDYPRYYTRERIATAYGAAWMYLWIAPVQADWRALAGDWLQPAGTD